MVSILKEIYEKNLNHLYLMFVAQTAILMIFMNERGLFVSFALSIILNIIRDEILGIRSKINSRYHVKTLSGKNILPCSLLVLFYFYVYPSRKLYAVCFEREKNKKNLKKKLKNKSIY